MIIYYISDILIVPSQEPSSTQSMYGIPRGVTSGFNIITLPNAHPGEKTSFSLLMRTVRVRVLRFQHARMRVSAQPLLYAHERRLSTWNAPVGTHTCPKAALTALLNSSASFLERNFAAKLAACGAPPDKVAVTLKAIFADADRQHTGSLPLEGVIDAIQALKAKCPLSKAALDAHTAVRHFEMADANNDGVISLRNGAHMSRRTFLRTRTVCASPPPPPAVAVRKKQVRI